MGGNERPEADLNDSETYEVMRTLALGLPLVGGNGNWHFKDGGTVRQVTDKIAETIIGGGYAAVVISEAGRAVFSEETERILEDAVAWRKNFSGLEKE